MRKIMFVGPALFAIYLACSGGHRNSATPPPPPLQDHSLRDALLRLSDGMCSLRETNDSHWVIDFQKGGRKNLVVERVGTDFIRLTDGAVRYDLPFSAIVLVTSDD